MSIKDSKKSLKIFEEAPTQIQNLALLASLDKMSNDLHIGLVEDTKKIISAMRENSTFRSKSEILISLCNKGEMKEGKELVKLYFNLVPYVSYILGVTPWVQGDIDTLYNKYEYIFDRVRQKCKMDSWISNMVPFQNIDSYKKTFVMMETIMTMPFPDSSKSILYQKKIPEFITAIELGFYRSYDYDTEISEETMVEIHKEIQKILKKGNKSIYREIHAGNHIVISEMFIDNFIFEKKEKTSIMDTLCKLAVKLYFAITEGKQELFSPNENEYIMVGIFYMYALADFAMLSKPMDKIKKGSKSIERGILLQITGGMDISPYTLLFLAEDQHIERFLKEFDNFSTKDIENIKATYDMLKNDEDIMSYKDYVKSAGYILILLKVLKKYSQGYNDILEQAQHLGAEVKRAEKLSAKLDTKTQEYERKETILEAKYQKMKKIIEDLEKENARLNSTIKKLKTKKESNSKELYSLREYVYRKGMETESPEELWKEQTIEEIKAQIKDLSVVIVGGHTIWNNKMKDEFPEWKFIGKDQTNVTNDAFRNAKCIFVFETHCTHAIYQKVISAIESTSTELGYIGSTVNIERSIRNIYDFIKQKNLI